MTQKSWHLNRREVIKGSGIALGLPALEAMQNQRAHSSESTSVPKRLLVSYIAYGTYMPEGSSGIPNVSRSGQAHNEWSWWPCAEAGELTFNKSSQPFEELKDTMTMECLFAQLELIRKPVYTLYLLQVKHSKNSHNI